MIHNHFTRAWHIISWGDFLMDVCDDIKSSQKTIRYHIMRWLEKRRVQRYWVSLYDNTFSSYTTIIYHIKRWLYRCIRRLWIVLKDDYWWSHWMVMCVKLTSHQMILFHPVRWFCIIPHVGKISLGTIVTKMWFHEVMTISTCEMIQKNHPVGWCHPVGWFKIIPYRSPTVVMNLQILDLNEI